MPTPAGEFDRRVTVLRRSEIPDDSGNRRGEFAPVLRVWCKWKPNPSLARNVALPEAGIMVDSADGVVIIRDSAEARLVTAADRLQLGAVPSAGTGHGDHAILSVSLPDRSGEISLVVQRDPLGAR